MDLIDKEHLAGVQRTQNRSQITSMLDGGTGSDADWNFQFIGHNHGQSGFAKSRRPRKQDLVRRTVTFSSSIEEKLQLRFESWLSDESLKDMRTKLLVADRFVADGCGGNHTEGFLVRPGVRLFECISVRHNGPFHLPLSNDVLFGPSVFRSRSGCGRTLDLAQINGTFQFEDDFLRAFLA